MTLLKAWMFRWIFRLSLIISHSSIWSNVWMSICRNTHKSFHKIDATVSRKIFSLFQWEQIAQQQQQQQQSQNQQNRNSGPNNLNSGRPGPGAQRYPTPIQRPTNYPPHQQALQLSQQQRPGRQGHSGGPGGGSMNKHYYNNSGANRGKSMGRSDFIANGRNYGHNWPSNANFWLCTS